MQSDFPHTLYIDKEKVRQEDIDYATKKTLEAMERKRQRMEAEKNTTVEELFKNPQEYGNN